VLNHVYLPPLLPAPARPGKTSLVFLIISCAAYFLLAILYLLALMRVI
jgi:hypothetical protein